MNNATKNSAKEFADKSEALFYILEFPTWVRVIFDRPVTKKTLIRLQFRIIRFGRPAWKLTYRIN